MTALVVALIVALDPAAAGVQDPTRRDTIVVTSVLGAWQSSRDGRLAVLKRLEVVDEVQCTSTEGQLRLSANGVPLVFECRPGVIRVTLPRTPGLSERWLRSLAALWAKPSPTFVPLVSRGEGPIEAIVPLLSDGLDLSRALSDVDTAALGVRFEPVGSGPSEAAIETEWRGRLLATRRAYAPGLYLLQLVTRDGRAVGEQALVFVPPPPRTAEAVAQFEEIRSHTASWSLRDARAFQVYCLSALAGELK